MTQGLVELKNEQLLSELERVLFPHLAGIVRSREPGHCMRISDLDQELMVRLCARLRAEVPECEAVVLGNGAKSGIPQHLGVTSTKLVELRNPRPDGTQRSPLLVFVPNDLRASAEDSFGIATFEAPPLGNVYKQAIENLLNDLPEDNRNPVRELLGQLEAGSRPWPFAEPLAQVRFLLTAKINSGDAEAIGASLYELGLVPDFELLDEPAKAAARLERNRECVQKLTWSSKTERGRVSDLELADRAYATKLGGYLASTGLEDVRKWTRRIALDRSAWGFAFHQWKFAGGVDYPDSICIYDVEVNLPVLPSDKADERTGELVGHQVLELGKDGLNKFQVTFQVDPIPARVHHLGKFVLQVFTQDHRSVSLVRNKAAWKNDSNSASVTFGNLNKVELEEGWHYVRVTAQTDQGDPIPLVNRESKPISRTVEEDDSAPRDNHSDPFFVLPQGDLDIESIQRAVPIEQSLVHALIRLQFKALNDDRDPNSIKPVETLWLDHKGRGRPSASDTIQVKFGKEGRVHIPVSHTLRELEGLVLSHPDQVLSWRVEVDQGGAMAPTAHITEWPNHPLLGAFLDARRCYFAAVQADSLGLVSQGADFRVLRPLIAQYAETYGLLLRDLLQRAESSKVQFGQTALTDLRRLLSIDTIRLDVRDFRGRSREAMLIGPTHPLRALWLATWTELSSYWLGLAGKSLQEYVEPTKDALLRYLSPIGFPSVLPVAEGHLLTTVDNLHPMWTLYAPSDEPDPRGLLGEVCHALSVPEPAIGGATIDGAYLASRVQRYLLQHPYVSTLQINAFNVGRGSLLADMLLQLQNSKKSAFPRMLYDIRLFVPDPVAPGVGEDLIALLSEDDDFSSGTGSHLSPKLAISVRSVQEFRDSPEDHAAHLTLLLDLFPAEEIGVDRQPDDVHIPVHGLVQDYTVEYHEDAEIVLWRRRPAHGPASVFPSGDDLTHLLSTLPKLLSAATAAVATGQSGSMLKPVITLALDSEDRALLHQVHEVSDWVMILDRNMGIEFFDHGSQIERPDYLIDHSPDLTASQGYKLAITSRFADELCAIVQPAMAQHGLRSDKRNALAILDQLRSLSGRLAFKLISASTQRTEALGLALARIFLARQGVFNNQIVLPLDAHLELYRRPNAEQGEEVSFKRTDLALFDLNGADRTITCRLVEVKCYTNVGDVGSYQQLRQRIAEQISQSEQTLRFHFDPERSKEDRPDRLLKSRELKILLTYYLDRSIRYGLIDTEAAAEAQYLLQTLELGYRLNFTRTGLVFDFGKPGSEQADLEEGIEFHRIGQDLIAELVQLVAPSLQLDDEPATTDQEVAVVTESEAQRFNRISSVPTLEKAAFLAKPRNRTVDWEELRSRQSEAEDGLGHQPVVSEKGADSREAISHEAGLQADSTQRTTNFQVLASGQDAPLQPPSPHLDEPAGEPSVPTEAVSSAPEYDVMLGVSGQSPQYGILGEVAGRKVAVDLNQTHTISLFGVQGGGKSYTLGTIAEMAALHIPQVNVLPRPLATVIFHYSQTMDYRPEFTSMVAPNDDPDQITRLAERYGAVPQALKDVLLLVPGDKLQERKAEYQGIDVRPLKFSSSELKPSHWRFLMGAVGNQALYLRQLNRVMKSMRNELTLGGLRTGLDAAGLPDHIRNLATERLNLAAEYIDDSADLSALIRPGRLVIVDLRDEFIEKDEALGLFVVVLQLIADSTFEGQAFNKLVVFDEAHKYIESPDLIDGLIEVVREMRHKGTSVMVASQDPPSVPVALIELSSQIIVHRFNSPAWLKHIQKANTALSELNAEKMSSLRPGEAYVWSSKATDDAFSQGAVKMRFRPRVTKHGGDTKTAV